MNFIKNALTHWHTSLAGLAAALLVIAGSYKQGMNWQQWGLASALALGGFAASDGAKAVTKTAIAILLFLPFGSAAMAQTEPPTQPFVLSTSGGTFNGQPITIGSAGVQLTAEKPVAVAVGYQFMFNPTDSVQPHFGGGITDTTFSLASIVPKAIKSKLLIDLTNYNLTLIAGAGVKSTFNGIGLPRTQHIVGDFGVSPSYPMPGGHVQVAPLYQILLGPHHKTDRVIGGTLNFTF